MDGLTGPIKFDARGFRTDFNMDIVELKQEGLVKVHLHMLNFEKGYFYSINLFRLCLC